MGITFRPATKKRSRLRMAIDGPSGSGKTYTSLRFATELGTKIAVINTESGAIEKYLGDSPDGVPFAFDVCELPDHSPSRYIEAIEAAGKAGYDVLIIDSLSHAWDGVSGALELVDKKGGNRFTAWKDVTPLHRRMIDAILRSPCHIIATMRTKMEYVLETDERGKQVPRKVGMAPVQRAGMEYEFDVVADMDWTHQLTVSKTRCSLIDGKSVVTPGVEFIRPVSAWLTEGVDSVSPDQIRELESLLSKAGIVGPTRDSLLAAKGMSSLDHFTRSEADELIGKLRARLEAQTTEATTEPAPVAAEPTPEPEPEPAPSPTRRTATAAGTEPASAFTETDFDPVRADQIETIRGLLAEVLQYDSTAKEVIIGKLKESGLSKLSDLNISEAENLILALRVRNLSVFIKSTLKGSQVPL